MAFVFACELPDHLWFDVDRDVWVQPWQDGTVRLGMTDPAQTRAGRIVYVRIRPGRTVTAGKSVATIESGKWVGPFPSPLAGTVLAANPDVIAEPHLINRDPYGQGWLVQLRPSDGQWRDGGQLLQGADAVSAYRTKLADEGLTCLRCAEGGGEISPSEPGMTM